MKNISKRATRDQIKAKVVSNYKHKLKRLKERKILSTLTDEQQMDRKKTIAIRVARIEAKQKEASRLAKERKNEKQNQT